MNAVIYARYSSHNQTEQSIEGQLADAYDYARAHDYTVVSEYIDRAQSGKTDNRLNFQRMISDAPKRQFQLVIVWKLDRFARNRYDSAIYKAKLKKYGVTVVSVKEMISDNPEGIILEGMLEAMAEYYSANLSVNVKRGMRETLKKGNYCGGGIPFGYKLDGKRFVIDENKAPILREVFERYASGEPKTSIIRDLNGRGVKTARGYDITMSTFQKVLSNPIYTGHYRFNGEEIPEIAPPLIPQDIFDTVQTMIAKHKHAPAATKAREEYILQGKAFCGICGANLVGDCGHSATGALYTYYSCAVKKKTHSCKKRNERKDYLEGFVLHKTLEYVLTPANIDMIAKSVVAEYDNEFGVKQIKSA